MGINKQKRTILREKRLKDRRIKKFISKRKSGELKYIKGNSTTKTSLTMRDRVKQEPFYIKKNNIRVKIKPLGFKIHRFQHLQAVGMVIKAHNSNIYEFC